jgi:hypothetical protein
MADDSICKRCALLFDHGDPNQPSCMWSLSPSQDNTCSEFFPCTTVIDLGIEFGQPSAAPVCVRPMSDNDRCGSDWAENGAQAPGQMSNNPQNGES